VRGHGDAEGMETIEGWECAPSCPIKLMDEQSGISASRFFPNFSRAERDLEPFLYCAKANKKERSAGLQALGRNRHPTVKPLSLMKWLIRLVTPPGGTVLDPFAGSGTTGVAAIAEGMRAILCEQDPDYATIIAARMRHAIERKEDA